MSDQLNSSLQEEPMSVKSYLPSPYPCYRLVLKKNQMREIMKVKGWRTYEDVAGALGFTRQYICMIDKTRVQVGPEFVTRLAAALGNVIENWWVNFEIIPFGVIDDRHPVWNNAKYGGKIPYSRYSPAANLRKNDYLVEELMDKKS